MKQWVETSDLQVVEFLNLFVNTTTISPTIGLLERGAPCNSNTDCEEGKSCFNYNGSGKCATYK